MLSTQTELTEEELRRLYLVEGLTEGEIASKFGTYQVRVNRLRKKFGIPTQVKTDRLKLPEVLSPRLLSVLVGSMLGDGGLQATGTQTASYIEHHSIRQKDYLAWKIQEWGLFASSCLPSNKGSYLGFRFRTHGCRALFPYWKIFYPSGVGDKTFADLDVDLVDDLALAVWFLDDGSRTTSSVRFPVGPDAKNQKVQLKVLRKFGLDVALYNDPEDTSIHIGGRSSLTKFVDLVSPHIPSCMSHKLELEVVRQAGPAPRDILTPEKVQAMLDRGMSAQAIALVFGVSRGSVGRAMARMGAPSRPTGRPRKSDFEFTLEEATSAISNLSTNSSEFIDEVVKILMRMQAPLPAPTQVEVAHDVDLLKKCPTYFDGSEFRAVSKAGSVLCSKHFLYRWDARYRDQPSVKQAWYDEKYLRQAISFQLRVGDPVTPIRVFRAIQAVVLGPTNFRPSLAKAVVEAFAPVGGLVLDPCAGYGGRAAGTLSSGRSYLGVDPNPKAQAAFLGMASDLGREIRFYNQPFEEFDEPSLGADLVFTSPPYYSMERYSDDSTQSWVRYKTWDSWLRGFLGPFVKKSWLHLKPRGTFCVNTKDIRFGKNLFPIGGELVRLASEIGFKLEKTLTIPLGRIGKDMKTEPLFVFRRPG